MIDSKEIVSDFQFIGNRVSNFVLETKMLDSKGQKISVDFGFDYNLLECKDDDDEYFGVLEFAIKIKAKSKASKSLLFKIDLVMEGAFIGNKSALTLEQFKDMLEINGVVTLSQISRSFILSVTSQSGINPPVRMPMINVVALKEKKTAKQNSK